MIEKNEFDHLADQYKENISPWMKITGETIEFYAQARIKWVARQLKNRGDNPHKILDYGCGIGLATPFFLEEFGNDCTITGVDVSLDSLEIAKSKYASSNVNFLSLENYTPDQSFDLVFCNGVFHHIPLIERNNAIRYVYDSLQPGGYFALWENNPWNPLTRYNMAHAEIDRNAIPIPPPKAKNMVNFGRFRLLMTRFHFIFPGFLRFLRPLEVLITQLPFGAQYVVFCRKVNL